jgi:hypothetical protein
MLNIAVFAPMPTASVKTTTAVKTGVLRNMRNACLKSRLNLSMLESIKAVLLPTQAMIVN